MLLIHRHRLPGCKSVLFLLLGVAAGLYWTPARLGAQCLAQQAPAFETLLERSEAVVFGQLVAQRSVWGQQRRLLYTVWELQLEWTSLELPAMQTSVWVVTEGGQLGLDRHVVHPAAPLQLGSRVGLLLAAVPKGWVKPDDLDVSGRLWRLSDPVEAHFHPQPGQQERYTCHGEVLTHADVERAVAKQLGAPLRMVQHPEPAAEEARGKTAVTPVVTGFSPAEIPAGAFDELTITGQNFGNTPGRVLVPNPDDQGASLVAVPQALVNSWNDTEIRLSLPTRAGSGRFRVENSQGESGLSLLELRVPYTLSNALSNDEYYLVGHSSENGQGGYTYRYAANFASNAAAVAAFERALLRWQCDKQTNLLANQEGQPAPCRNQDGVNVVSFDAGCDIGSSTLGRTYQYYRGCQQFPLGPLEWHLLEWDIVFAASPPNAQWNFARQNPTPTQSDFESVALHELGHVLLLNHVNLNRAVMNARLTRGERVISLTASEDQGYDRVRSVTATGPFCGSSAYQDLNTAALPCNTLSRSNFAQHQQPPWRLAPLGTGPAHTWMLHPTDPNTGARAPLRAELLDLSGRSLRSFSKLAPNQPFSLGELPTGIYLLRVQDGRRAHTFRLPVH